MTQDTAQLDNSRIQDELSNKSKRVLFLDILKGLIKRDRLGPVDKIDLENSLEDLIQSKEQETMQEFNERLKKAEDLCNLTPDSDPKEHEFLRKIQAYLEEYRTTDVKAGRHKPLVNALNYMLLLNTNNREPNVIFVDNDVIIKSAEGTERKPGIIVIYLITCKKWLGADKYNFEDCRAAIACGLLDDKTERYWTDVIQCWELTSSSGEETSVADELMISEGYMQSTFYAIEQSHISWKVSHVTGIHLRDTSLEFLWYDPGGRICSAPIDIIHQLSLLIVLVTIQRDSRYLHGLRTIKLPGNIYDHKIPAFQLGRKTYGAPFAYTSLTSSSSTINIAQPAAANATHFFKVSWREDRFPKKEHEIIEEARERARKLPKKHWTSIEDHLPVIQDAELLTDTSTAIIRTILGLERKYSRSLYWMISKKLERIERIVPEFQKFQKAYWDIVRCHRLLWLVGIAHSDISFGNLMYDPDGERGILNDFDMTMAPGTDPAEVRTKEFMATDLLSAAGLAGKIVGRYRHDLESFAWALLWAAVSIDPAGTPYHPSKEPFATWLHQNHALVGISKDSFLIRFEQNIQEHVPEDSKYRMVVTLSLYIWANQLFSSNVRNPLQTRSSQPEVSDQELLTQALEAWGISKGPDHDWIDIQGEDLTSNNGQDNSRKQP